VIFTFPFYFLFKKTFINADVDWHDRDLLERCERHKSHFQLHASDLQDIPQFELAGLPGGVREQHASVDDTLPVTVDLRQPVAQVAERGGWPD
jgi:hypothetical protein